MIIVGIPTMIAKKVKIINSTVQLIITVISNRVASTKVSGWKCKLKPNKIIGNR